MMKSVHNRSTVILMAVILVICMAFSTLSSVFMPADAAGTDDKSVNKMHYWSFDENTSDASGALDLSSKSEIAYAEGKHNKALDTSSGPAVRSDSIPDNTLRGFSMGAWFTLNSGATEWNIIMSKGNTMENLPERFQIHIGHASESAGGGKLLAYIPGAGGGLSNETDGIDVPYDTWTFATVTYDLSTVRMYVNGELAAEKAVKGSLDVSLSGYNTVTVGALNHDGGTLRFNGLIDDAFYANYPMTEADVKRAFEDNAALKAWADGSAEIVPGDMEDIEAPPTPAPTAEPDPGKGKLVWFWPFDGNSNDLSHKRLDQDDYGDSGGYEDAVVGKGVVAEMPILSKELPSDIDLSEFTIALWVRWDDNAQGGYTVPIAIAEKGTGHHFELYYTVDGSDGELAYYNTGTGLNVEHIAPVERDVFYHIAATCSGSVFTIYLNGEQVYTVNRAILMRGLGSEADHISLGGLTDMTLGCAGIYDEVVLADYAFTPEMIAKLYSDPAGAHDDVVKLVEANYPEGYTPPTEIPTKEPATQAPATEAATEAPEVTEGAEPDEKTPVPGKTSAPTSPPDKDNKNSATPIIIAAVAGAVIIAAAVAAAIIAKKKKK